MNSKELALLLKNISILYVEDEQDTREAMYQVLTLLCDEVYLACTGEEALEYYYEKRPEIIISDIVMPLKDGLSFIKEVRETDMTTPIILLTAHTNKEYLLPAANLNIQSYLVKPVKTTQLKEVLLKAVNLLKGYKTTVKLPNNLEYNLLNSEIKTSAGHTVKLNKKEKKLMDLFLTNQNRVITYTEIENSVWVDYDEVMTSMALRTLIKNLRKKISPEFIENISGQGYKVIL